MGRYLERSENVARVLKLEYFAALDSPVPNSTDIALKTVANIFGIKDFNFDHTDYESKLLLELCLDKENPSSILNTIKECRNNAHGCRDLLSSESWQNINTLFHFAKDYDTKTLATTGLYEFTNTVGNMCSTISASIDNTLLHDNVWDFIKLGIHFERSIQIVRIIQQKALTINEVVADEKNSPLANHLWIGTLNLFDALDMVRKLYQKTPNRNIALEFLLFEEAFPAIIELQR